MSAPCEGDDLAALLAPLETIGLEALGSATLLERIDTKYIIPVALLPLVMKACGREYRALEVGDRRVFDYQTRYFDTRDFRLYRAHVSERHPRNKVRIRRYGDHSAPVLELKRKAPRGSTEKLRKEVSEREAAALEELRLPPFEGRGAPDPAELRPALDITFRRATLVRLDGSERVTIDQGVRCEREGRHVHFPAVAIVEVKQARRARSPVTDAMRSLRQRPARISKYCIGVAALVPGVPVHELRRTLARLYSAPATLGGGDE